MKSIYQKEPVPYRIMYGKNLSYYAHFHQQTEIIYCITGQISVILDGVEYMLQEGDTGVVFPNRHHYYPGQQEKENEIYLLLFYPEDTQDYCCEWQDKLPHRPVIRKEELPDIYHSLWKSFYETCSDRTDAHLFKAYAGILTAHLMPHLKLYPAYTKGENGYSQDIMSSVLHYVDKHFTEHITMESVAKNLGLSPVIVSRMFSKTMGTNFKQHVNTLRISYARRMLRSSNYSINEISFLSGFQSKRTFFRNFHEMCNQTPGEYREKMRK